MAHYASTIVLDEDVWEEMRLWMKGLVAMWRDDDDQDCVFVENAIFVREQKHMIIECELAIEPHRNQKKKLDRSRN